MIPLVAFLCFCRFQNIWGLAITDQERQGVKKGGGGMWFPIFFSHCVTFSASCCDMAFSGWCTGTVKYSSTSQPKFPTKHEYKVQLYLGFQLLLCRNLLLTQKLKRSSLCLRKQKEFASSLKSWNNGSFQNTPWLVICKPHLGLCFKHSWCISSYSTLQTARTAAIGKEVVC